MIKQTKTTNQNQKLQTVNKTKLKINKQSAMSPL